MLTGFPFSAIAVPMRWMHDAGFPLISLRPVGGHDGLRRAAARAGGRLIALSPWRITPRDDADARASLREAMRCPVVLFTSPASVRAAAALAPLRMKRGQAWLAVGEGTRRALQRAGVADASSPARMDSEGLLAMPALASLQRGDVVGLVTAPGGRGEIVRQLAARGIDVRRADVYARMPVRFPPSRIEGIRMMLDDAASPVFLALSSGEAFEHLLAQWPPSTRKSLQRVCVIAASERLASLAREHGFKRIRAAKSARPGDLVAAITGASP